MLLCVAINIIFIYLLINLLEYLRDAPERNFIIDDFFGTT